MAVPEYEEEDYIRFNKVRISLFKGKRRDTVGREEGKGDMRRKANVPNKASEYKTFMPKKAGKRSLRKFMMARNMPATAPGLATRSLRLGTLTLRPILPAACAA